MGQAFIINPGWELIIILGPGHGGSGCAMTPGLGGGSGWTMIMISSLVDGAGMRALVLCGEVEEGAFRVFIIRLIL